MCCGPVWPLKIPIVFQRPLTVPSIAVRPGKLPAIMPVPGDCDLIQSVYMTRCAWNAWAVWTLLHHDDVIKWKHFPRYWPFVRGIHRSPVNSPHKGQWRGALMFSLIWISGWVNNHVAGGLRRHRAHYNVIVMVTRYHVKPVHITTPLWEIPAGLAAQRVSNQSFDIFTVATLNKQLSIQWEHEPINKNEID